MIEKASHLVGGPRLVEFAKTIEESIKNLWSPGMLFEELGFRYFGPIPGHDIPRMVDALKLVSTLKGPRVVHVITEKGKGFPLPEPDLEKYHARAPYDPVTGKLKPVNPGPPQWTKVFGEAITQLAAEHPAHRIGKCPPRQVACLRIPQAIRTRRPLPAGHQRDHGRGRPDAEACREDPPLPACVPGRQAWTATASGSGPSTDFGHCRSRW